MAKLTRITLSLSLSLSLSAMVERWEAGGESCEIGCSYATAIWGGERKRGERHLDKHGQRERGGCVQ